MATSAAEDTFSPDVKVYLIYPATDLHIRKYTVQPRVLVRETPDLYSSVTLPYIKSIPDKRTAWVQNILDGLKEQDSVVLADSDPLNGFVLVPDSKWDRRRMEELYLQVLCRNPAIGSLRDLRAEHLPLLKGIREKVGIRIEELYEGVKREHLRMFIHYQPSYCELRSERLFSFLLWITTGLILSYSYRPIPCPHHSRQSLGRFRGLCRTGSFVGRRDREPRNGQRVLRQTDPDLRAGYRDGLVWQICSVGRSFSEWLRGIDSIVDIGHEGLSSQT